MHTETSCKYLPYAYASSNKFLYTCHPDVIQLLLDLYMLVNIILLTYINTRSETIWVDAAILCNCCVSCLSVLQIAISDLDFRKIHFI